MSAVSLSVPDAHATADGAVHDPARRAAPTAPRGGGRAVAATDGAATAATGGGAGGPGPGGPAAARGPAAADGPGGAAIMLARIAPARPPVGRAAAHAVLLDRSAPGRDGGWSATAPATLAVLPGGADTRATRAAGGGPAIRRAGAMTDAEARGIAGVAARVLLEVLAGLRPATALRPLLGDRALATVGTLLRGGLSRPVRRPVVRISRVDLPTARAIEASGVFTSDGLIRAIALRLDRDRRRWVTTAFRVG